MINGFLNIIKPQGMSSAFAVGIAKKRLKANCGHMGTLDPMASGVLPLGLNRASRLFRYLLDKEKEYVATLKFGELTDTLDATGVVTQTTSVLPNKTQIITSLNKFVGEIMQVPPNYSAKNINGKRGYELARQGVDFTLPPKKVLISAIDLIDFDGEIAKIKVACGGGTYIRSLVRDIGYECGSLATMTALDRAKAGVFTYENGIEVEKIRDIQGDYEKYLIRPDSVVDFPKLVLDGLQAKRLINGLKDRYNGDGLVRVYNQEFFWGVGRITDGVLKMEAFTRDDE